jgi:hypothetical protein
MARGVLLLSILAAAFCLPLTGCSAPLPPPAERSKPVFLSTSVEGNPGTRVDLPHYTIFSTLEDRAVLNQLCDVLENGFAAYRSVAGDVPVSPQPMVCYVFGSRTQWAAYTKAHAGEDAGVYLLVNRGGYTAGDQFVAYWIGDTGTFSVAAHEGWHQFAARNLKGRFPPFLEEGIACLFEQPQWIDGLPRFDTTHNPPRLSALRAAADGEELYTLNTLVRMHAGQVVGKRAARIEAFYAESWAFARFLLEGEHGRYRPALNRMIQDAARGELFADDSIESPSGGGPLWNPASAKPMLEHYLDKPLDKIEIAFAKYVRELAAK